MKNLKNPLSGMFRLQVVVFLFLTGFSNLNAQIEAPLDSALAARVDSIARWELGRQDIIGMAVGIVRNGQIAFLNTYGYSDWENQAPVTLESEFRWASMSKSLTSVVAMKLYEQGALNLDTLARVYVPSWPDSTIRVSQLLQNRSGIGHYPEMDKAFPQWKRNLKDYKPDSTWNAERALSVFRGAPLLFRPDSTYMYSTFGFILAGAAIDYVGRNLYGRGYLDLVDEYVSRPLGMRTLKPDFLFGDNSREVKGYYRDRRGDIRPRKDDDVSWKIPGGGYQSTILDLTKYVQGLMRRQILQTASYNRLWAKQPDTDYAMGFSVNGAADTLLISHTGSQNKTRTVFAFYPNLQLGIGVMCNSEWVNPSEVAMRILEYLRVSAPLAAPTVTTTAPGRGKK